MKYTSAPLLKIASGGEHEEKPGRGTEDQYAPLHGTSRLEVIDGQSFAIGRSDLSIAFPLVERLLTSPLWKCRFRRTTLLLL